MYQCTLYVPRLEYNRNGGCRATDERKKKTEWLSETHKRRVPIARRLRHLSRGVGPVQRWPRHPLSRSLALSVSF
jgi:hypothetical protein